MLRCGCRLSTISVTMAEKKNETERLSTELCYQQLCECISRCLSPQDRERRHPQSMLTVLLLWQKGKTRGDFKHTHTPARPPTHTHAHANLQRVSLEHWNVQKNIYMKKKNHRLSGCVYPVLSTCVSICPDSYLCTLKLHFSFFLFVFVLFHLSSVT